MDVSREVAQARLDAALNHTQQASADNGGAALAAGGHQPAYLLDTPPATLWTQLCDTHQQVSLPLRLSDFTGEVVTGGLGSGMPFCLRVADVLTLHAGEADAGMIPGAVNIPVGQLPDRTDELDPARPTVVYCAGGYRSSVAASLLRQHGFTDVSDILGGYNAWAEAVQNA